MIVGPGPGDPRDDDDPKMLTLRAAIAALLAAGRPFLAVCLGHQALCHQLGIPLGLQGHRLPGHPVTCGIDGRTERVGFYNTFVGRAGGRRCPTASRSRPTPRPATST